MRTTIRQAREKKKQHNSEYQQTEANDKQSNIKTSTTNSSEDQTITTTKQWGKNQAAIASRVM